MVTVLGVVTLGVVILALLPYFGIGGYIYENRMSLAYENIEHRYTNLEGGPKVIFWKPLQMVRSENPGENCESLSTPKRVVEINTLESALTHCNANIDLYNENQNIRDYFLHGADYASTNELLQISLNHIYVNIEALEYLLELGYDVNTIGEVENKGSTPLLKALGGSNVPYEAVQMILEWGGDPKYKRPNGESVLSLVDGNKNVPLSLYEIWIQRGIVDVNDADDYGYIPLGIYIYEYDSRASTNTIDWFLSMGADPNLKTLHPETGKVISPCRICQERITTMQEWNKGGCTYLLSLNVCEPYDEDLLFPDQ